MPEAGSATRSPIASSTAWQGPLFLLAALALAAGVAAAATAGLSRRLALLALLAAGLAMAGLVSSRRMPAETGVPLGGAGYTPPESRWVRSLHAVLSLAHNGGIMVVVFAALVRFEVVPLHLPDALLQAFPLALGIYLLLLAVAAKQRIDERGGVVRTWYTRSHGWFLAILSMPILAAGVALLALPTFELGSFTLTEPDLQVLVLVGMLGVGMQMFLAVHLPTLFDLMSDLVRAVTAPGLGRGTPPVVYAALLAVGLTALIGFLLLRFDVVSTFGGFRDERVGLLLVLVPVGLALFLLSSAIQLWREARRGLYTRRISATVRSDLVVYGFSAVAGIGLTILLGLNLLGQIDSIGPFPGGRTLSKDLIVLTILATTGPIGWHMTRRTRRIDAIEGRLPDFLNDLAETRRAGLTLAASLQACSLSDYGALSPEIKKMANQVSWGVSFTEALAQFGERVKTNLVRRSVHLIIEASKTGGSVADILKAAARDAYEIKALEAERRVSMMTYLIVIYVVYFVFLVVIVVLDVRFIPEVIKANEATATLGIEDGPIGGGLDAGAMRFAFFNAAMVQAIGNGVVGGVLSEGRVSAGFRHVALMASASWILFRVLG